MWQNLFISFEINDSNTNTENFSKAIHELGNTTKLHESCWYVNSKLDANAAIKRIGKFLNKSDVLVIADTTNNISTWFNLSESLAVRLRQNWKLNKDIGEPLITTEH
jgi:hypothetical protein